MAIKNVIEENIEAVVETSQPKTVKKAKTGTVNADTGLNMRDKASADGSVIEILPVNTILKVTGDIEKEWVKVTTPEGATGFVKSEFLTF